MRKAPRSIRNQAEYQLYDAAAKDSAANNFTKAIADLDVWSKSYPDSDFKDDRQVLYVQAYAGAKQPAKAIDAAGPLLSTQDLDATSVIKLLFTTATAIQQLPSATAEQFAIGEKPARQLLAYDKKPDGVSADAWAQANAQLHAAAKGALLYIALLPGTQAMQNNDCSAAETAFTRALEENPDSAQAAYGLGRAQPCLYKTMPEKASPAIYEFALPRLRTAQTRRLSKSSSSNTTAVIPMACSSSRNWPRNRRCRPRVSSCNQ